MPKPSKRVLPVLLAAAVVLVLAGSVLLRARARLGGLASDAPAARVAAPKPAELSRLEIPCWSCADSRDWPVRSRVDLDLLAPLGDGPGNAAIFLRDFAEATGTRTSELARAREQMIDGPEDLGKVFPPSHPLLAEAEPWTEQATMRFYPDLLALDGWDTEIPDLLFPLQLAKSWVARGRATGGEAALDDYRRAVRLGRLLRQEDTTIIQDLVGLACLRIGLGAIYDAERDRGNLAQALVASIALGEIAPQRLLTSERVTRVDVSPYLSDDLRRLDLPAAKLETIVKMAESDPDRRFRGEAILDLGIVAHLGVGEVRERARQVLEGLRDDERIASLAIWSLTHPPGEEALRGPAAP